MKRLASNWISSPINQRARRNRQAESAACSKAPKSFAIYGSTVRKRNELARTRRDRAQGKEIVTPLAEPADLELIRRIATTGGKKYTGGNIDRRKYQRLVALGWLTETSVNVSDVLYEITDAGKAAVLRDD